MLIKFKKGDKLQITNHFNSSEFECPCKKCTEQFIDSELVNKLEDLRNQYGSGIKITSGYRCPAHNVEVGGVPNSAHSSGIATDIQPSVMNVDELDKLYDLAYKLFSNIGDGRRLKFVHVDTRPAKADGKKRTWTY
jgi:uncharacterized protein YcbK (DUF882 family)